MATRTPKPKDPAKLQAEIERLKKAVADLQQSNASLAAALMASQDEAQRFKAGFVQQRARADEAEELVVRWRASAERAETALAARAEPAAAVRGRFALDPANLPPWLRRPAPAPAPAAPLPFTEPGSVDEDEDQDDDDAPEVA